MHKELKNILDRRLPNLTEQKKKFLNATISRWEKEAKQIDAHAVRDCARFFHDLHHRKIIEDAAMWINANLNKLKFRKAVNSVKQLSLWKNQ
ncbi:hypothetical protein FUAX_09950 [Fulvitalea axinellae]|uniref:Uncharacterized protein n=1 Tax=Fulvitalea axinellae TaxID=1182444 RepID=A0AAU9CF63_9BACT|nr:hypothetical protein FUAX_09950 [Fulvitalea axinellae]